MIFVPRTTLLWRLVGCWSVLLVGSMPAQESAGVVEEPAPAPRIVVVHRSLEHRVVEDWAGIVPVSIPFPRGAHRVLTHLAIAGSLTPCTPLIYWPDGSIAVVRAWPMLQIRGGQTVELGVRPVDGQAVLGRVDSAEAPSWFAEDLRSLRGELEDPWGVRYVAILEPVARPGDAADDGFVRRSARERVRRFAGRLVAEDGTALFEVRAYLTTYVAERRAELTVLLDNTFEYSAEGGPGPIGPVRFRRFDLTCADSDWRFVPRFGARNLLRAQTRSGRDGVLRIHLLGPSDHLYLGDGTAKAFRFDVSSAGEPPPPRPLAIPSLDWTRHTGSFGAHGGPAPIDAVDAALEAASLQVASRWVREARFGPFGDFGDPADAAAQGTPRNGPSRLHDVVRWRSPELLAIAESQLLQHTLRSTPGRTPRLPRETAEFRQGLSPRTVRRPHGFTRPDYEHFSVDLLFDLYWLTADPLALDELVRLGRGLPRVLRGLPFRTSRGEGWCMQAAVSIHRAVAVRVEPASGRACAGLLDGVLDRFLTDVLPEMGVGTQPFAIRQPPHADALGEHDHPFDAPWQMAALVHGLAAVWRETGHSAVAGAVIRTADLMADVGFVDGVGPKYLMSAIDTTRYRMPVGFLPLEGTAPMHVGAFVLAEELVRATNLEADRSRYASRADFLMDGRVRSRSDSSDPWFQIYLDRRDR